MLKVHHELLVQLRISQLVVNSLGDLQAREFAPGWVPDKPEDLQLLRRSLLNLRQASLTIHHLGMATDVAPGGIGIPKGIRIETRIPTGTLAGIGTKVATIDMVGDMVKEDIV